MKKLIAGSLVLLLCLVGLGLGLPPSMAATTVVYDFLANASSLTWVTVGPGSSITTLTFGNTANPLDGVVTSFSGMLEDGVSYSNAVLVLLPYSSHSAINGYPDLIPVPAQAQLELVYGFQQGSSATDGVEVEVAFQEDKPGSSRIQLHDQIKTYDGTLGKATIDLSACAGQTGRFSMWVAPGATPTDDKLVWVKAVMTTSTTSPTSPPGPTTTFLQFHINDPTYFVNGAPKTMDTAPVIVESRTFLPIRYVVEEIGGKADWYAPDQKVTITFGSKTIELWIGQNSAAVNGTSVPIDPGNPNVAPFIQPPGRTMMPLRFISENLGCKVDWLPPAEVQITYPAP